MTTEIAPLPVADAPIDPLLDGPVRTRPIERPTPAGPTRANRRKLGRDTHRWSRLIHVYTSMVALIVVLFFAVTGISLNHPEWTFGSETSTTVESGSLPFATELTDDSGNAVGVDYLSVAEYVREELGVVGSVDSFGEANGEASIAFVNPGYRADVLVDLDTGGFDLTVEQEGWVAVVNDLHTGSDTGSAWGWLIDASAGMLIIISLTGLVMQFFLKKRRRSAFVVAGAGAVLVAMMVVVTLM